MKPGEINNSDNFLCHLQFVKLQDKVMSYLSVPIRSNPLKRSLSGEILITFSWAVLGKVKKYRTTVKGM